MDPERKSHPKYLGDAAGAARDDDEAQGDEFLRRFFRKGARIMRALLRERDELRRRVVALEEENVLLRARLGDDASVDDLQRRIDELEQARRDASRRISDAEELRVRHEADAARAEADLAGLASLYVATYQLHASLEPGEVLRHIAELAEQFLGARSFALYVADDAGRRLLPLASGGLAEGPEPLQVDEGPVGLAYLTGVAAVTAGDPRDGSAERPAAVIPLQLQGAVRGVFVLYRTLAQKETFSPGDRELLRLLGDQAMPALAAARLYADRTLDLVPPDYARAPGGA
ncbi:MAG TPA: GAF domain-containing protein [Polyangiaceae bacterium]|nr:GAF domain-containing protein [Polyangiaceae bacterium]